MNTEIHAPDLTKQAPRSPRARLGGYALLPRMLDKGRAELVGKSGDYHYNCPLDQRILEFLGIDAEALKTELAKGKGDGEILAWIREHQTNRRTLEEIEAWSGQSDVRKPDAESQSFFDDLLKGVAPHRTDVTTWCELLDVDDYVSFGGKA